MPNFAWPLHAPVIILRADHEAIEIAGFGAAVILEKPAWPIGMLTNAESLHHRKARAYQFTIWAMPRGIAEGFIGNAKE